MKVMIIKKSMVYRKLFVIYTLVILFLIGILDIYFTSRVVQNRRENIFSLNDMSIHNVNDELNKIKNSSVLVVSSMYSDYEYINDVVDFLNTSQIDYLKKKLDKFSESKISYYKGIEYFVKRSFSADKYLNSIEFVRNKNDDKIKFHRNNKIISSYSGGPFEYKNQQMFDNDEESKDEIISYTKEIRNPISLEVDGHMILNYDISHIKDIIKKYDIDNEVKVLDSDGLIIFDSTKQDYGKYYKDIDKLTPGKIQKKLDKDYYINSLNNNNGLTIVAKVKKSYVKSLPIGFYISLGITDFFVFAIVELIFYMKIKKLGNRMDGILLAMDEVKNGNVNVSIPIGSEHDEINFIAQNFNEMCTRLDEYIKKSYLSELKEKEAQINQKQAEMMALQSQINPHFLYNTLESIRMKAICNGDKEIGKMIYILAVLFRSQLKEKNIIPIKSEIEYCKKYLEIFKFRYDEKFKFNIECEDELLDKQIIKFSIQPLIENYFIHGIRLEDKDNELSIQIFKEDDTINVIICDNGKGIPKEQLDNLNTMLNEMYTSGKSIGIANANARIAIEYGYPFGIRLENNLDKGTKVIMKLPCREVE